MTDRFAFVGRRLLSLIPLLLGILLVVMLLLSLTPGDPARLVVGPRASDEAVADARAELGLDQPIWQRYITYVGRVLAGDLGTSFQTGQPVAGEIASQIPVTLAVAALGMVLALLVSVPLAILASRRPDGPADHVVRFLGTVGIGMPSFWIAVMAITYIAMPTGWFPVAGIGNTPLENLRALVLPSVVVAISVSAPMVRSLRSTMIDLDTAEHVLAARALGFPERDVLRRFQLRNSVGPLVAVAAAQAGYALFGTVVVEVAFSLPGMGQGLVVAAGMRDFPLVQGYTLVFAVLVVILYLFADLVTAFVDPRVRITA